MTTDLANYSVTGYATLDGERQTTTSAQTARVKTSLGQRTHVLGRRLSAPTHDIMPFFSQIYPSWKAKQEEKYIEILQFLNENSLLEDTAKKTLLDIGIGEGWFEEFMKENGKDFERIVGVEPADEIKHLDYVDYVFTRNLETGERFDYVVCIDALHLVKYDITQFAKEGGIIIACLPLSFSKSLEKLNKIETIIKAEIGKQEKDILIIGRI